jgi:hypothetical protein
VGQAVRADSRRRRDDGRLYGDLQGIAGRSMQEIEGLEMPLIDGPAATKLRNEA